MMRIIIITPTRKSRTVKTQTIAAAQMSAADRPAMATKAPHPSAMASAAATAAHCSGVSARIEGTGFSIAAMGLCSRRAGEARRRVRGNRGEELAHEGLLRGVGGARIRRKTRDAHEHAVGHDAVEPRGELDAETLEAAAHDAIA